MGKLAEPAGERLWVARPHANVDAARQTFRVEPPTGHRKPRDVRRPSPPAWSRRRVEADLMHDRLCAIDIGAELSAPPKRIDDQPAPVVREDELAQMHMPAPLPRPADELRRPNHLARLDRRL